MNQDQQLREALEANGCERLKDFYNVGPVQRAAVESFVAALTATQQAAPSQGAGELPQLPEGKCVVRGPASAFNNPESGSLVDFDCEGPLSHCPEDGEELFTADQMRDYARAALLEASTQREQPADTVPVKRGRIHALSVALGNPEKLSALAGDTVEDSLVEMAATKLVAQREQPDEADELLRRLGLDPEQYRTDGGAINHLKVKAAIRHPESYPYLNQCEHLFVSSADLGGRFCKLCGRPETADHALGTKPSSAQTIDNAAASTVQPAASNPEPQAQAGEPLITIEPAIRGYQRFMDEDEETDPVERLRFFCSIAMNGQDWLDVEKFFDDVIAERAKKDAAQPAERVALTREQAEEARRVWLYGPVGHQSAFIAGIRYAEEAHGITAKDQS